MSVAALLDALLDESVDDGTTLLSCVCVCCSPPSLLTLTRCSTRLRRAVAAPLQQAEQRSAAKVTEHVGGTLEQLAAGNVVAWCAGLTGAQCWHLGVWLQPGGPLEGVTTLRLQKDDNKVTSVDLAPIRSGATAVWKLNARGLDDELMIILARLIAVNATVTELYLEGNSIGNTGAAAIANAIAVNASVTELSLGFNKIGDQAATAIANAIAVNAVLKELELYGNEIGAAGAIAIAESLKFNASLKLKELFVPDGLEKNAQLVAACRAKGVKLV